MWDFCKKKELLKMVALTIDVGTLSIIGNVAVLITSVYTLLAFYVLQLG